MASGLEAGNGNRREDSARNGSGGLRARYRRILFFAARALGQTWWYELVLPRIGLAELAVRSRSRRMRTLAQRFHVLAVDLGGLMIKVGQFMSARMDVLPPEVTQELEGLQDQVSAAPFSATRNLAEEELGRSLSSAFKWFDSEPIAAASLGQVHRARLLERDAELVGFTNVVVKVQRPGIQLVVATDLAALRRVAGWLHRIRFIATRVDVPALVEEFAVTSGEEIDYLHEAAAAGRFAENFADDSRVAAPGVAWELSSRRLLTLSDVTAIKINDVVALRNAGIDPADVARVFADVMFDQLFVHNYVHADPHPGNIFVTPMADAGWRLTFVDFGMMTEVATEIRKGLRSLIIAVASRDGAGLVAAAEEIGVLLPTTDTRELERALTAVFARFGGMGFGQLQDLDPREFQEFASEFGDMVRSLPIQLPEGLLLLIRAVSLTSGVCSGLNTQFNIWESIEPYAGRLLSDQSSNLLHDISKQAATTVGTTLRLPKRIDNIITRIDEGSVTFDTSRLERQFERLYRLVRRAVFGLLFAALLISGAIVLTTYQALGITLMVVSVIPLLVALLTPDTTKRPGR